MMNMTLSHAAEILGLDSAAAPVTFTGVSFDSRKIVSGNLFIALKGERVDGHDFLEAAHQNGAVAALVTKKMPSPLPQLIVEDTTHALGQLAYYWRNQFNIPFIGITGSNGKTTLKNMVSAILVAACDNDANQVLNSKGNLNNHLGLPLTLTRLGNQHRFAVIEMGMNHFGEIEYLTKMARPTVAAITNAAAAHLEGVGDLAGVARAKAEIFLGLPAQDGMAVLNRDDAFFPFWRGQIGHHQYLTFGYHHEADISVHSISENKLPDAHTTGVLQTVTLKTPIGNVTLNLPLLGKHNVLNAMAATAIALAIGIDLATIKAGLESVQPEPGRLHVYPLANGAHVIDDSYNANPVSLKAAIDTLANFAGKKILVLGDMKELGTDARQMHKEAGSQIRSAHIDYLFTFGDLSAHTAQAFGEGAFHFTEQEKLLNALKPFLSNQTTILVKGSRSMRMEKVVTGLVNP